MVTVSAVTEDYAQIDLKLAIQRTPILSEEPPVGSGYASFTPTQRYHFLQWVMQVDVAAPTAFRHLYLAHLETNLFDEPHQQQAAHQELCRLATLPTWQGEALLWRALLLSFQLTAAGDAFSRWLPTAQAFPTPMLGSALGQLALSGEPLTLELLSLLLQRWQRVTQLPALPILQLRLDFLVNSLGADPLAHLREQLDDAALAPKPWRSAHRDLRLQLVQPDLRQGMLPLLRDLSIMTERTTDAEDEVYPTAEQPAADQADDAAQLIAEDDGRARGKAGKKRKWQLVLEFGDSRSELFTFALNHAKKQPGYLQIMDENRRMIHRVHFEKTEMRRFWRLWEYVQSWSSTQVYLNGKEIHKANIYPYSPSLR